MTEYEAQAKQFLTDCNAKKNPCSVCGFGEQGVRQMELNINKDEAQLIHCALIYYLQRGAVYWYKDTYPKADLECIFNQLNIIEQVEE